MTGAAGQLETAFAKRLTAIGSLAWPGILAWVLKVTSGAI